MERVVYDSSIHLRPMIFSADKLRPRGGYDVHIVGVGVVYDSYSYDNAFEVFQDYIRLSKDGLGISANRPVVLVQDGETLDLYHPDEQED